ncbi:helicase domain protein [Nitzschia inconspicua]|uniref:Helicase domain protein n=1 Tax=Nitzschia inconspicua TaxID=303405 RepID=A0A9K3KCL3_9STRA|nr:helicase domain protein [Nitzschia inconspicua]
MKPTFSSISRWNFHISSTTSSTIGGRSQSKASRTTRESKREQTWDSVYFRLVKFQNEHGHTEVPNSFNDGDQTPHLGRWVSTQRYLYNRKDPPYPKRRAEKLDSIGFVWAFTTQDLSNQRRDEETWKKTARRLKEYKQQHGHTNVPSIYNDGQNPHLGIWVSHQRKKYKEYQNKMNVAGFMTKERIELLESLGFEWSPGRKDEFEETWMSHFDDLKEFVKKYNTTKVSNVPRGYNCRIAVTIKWANQQRASYNQFMRNETSTITGQQIDLLNSIDFAWNLTKKTTHENWIHEYFKLYWHHFQHNNTNISQSIGYNGDFVYWVEMQKRDYNAGKLEQGKIDLLNDLNFDWTPDPVATWEGMYEQLSQYYDRFGSTLINTNINRDLGIWTSELRILYSKGDLDPTWVAKLNHLKFDWKAEDVNWNAMLERLVAYKKKHGTVCVPRACPDDPPLGRWVQLMRNTYKHLFMEKMDGNSFENHSAVLEIAQEVATKQVPAIVHASRLSKLLEIGFVWNANDAQWQEMYSQLVAYKKSNGNTLVPHGCQDCSGLAVWWLGFCSSLLQLRTAARKSSTTERHTKKRVSTNKQETKLEKKWESTFQRLVEFQNIHGHTKVPKSFNDGDKQPHLGRWVSQQRCEYKRKDPPYCKERAEKLNSIGFVWSLDATWESTFQRLVQFQNIHGHTIVPISFNDGDEKPHLGRWVSQQRYQYKKKEPPYCKERAEKLNSIGFVWTLDAEDIAEQQRDEETWNTAIQRLKVYKQQHGHVNVPSRYNDGQRPHLGTWVSHQRNHYREYQNPNYSVGLITKERIEILESLGFEWNPGREDEYEEAWMSHFKDMKKFVKKYNTTKVSNVPAGCKGTIASLFAWAHNQRTSYNQYIRNKTSTIKPQQIDLLNSIGFAWNLKNKTSHEKWIHEYFKLYWHHLQHNNTNISQSNGYNSDFVYWVKVQKRDFNAGKLAQGKIDLLNDLNFDWTLDPVATWEEMYEQLLEYYERFGSTLINTNINKELGMWTNELRMLYSKGDLDSTWVAKLNCLKFDWKAEDGNWNAMFDRLVAYKKKHGTVCVPFACPDDPPLSNWVETNRKAYKHILTRGMDGISVQNQSAVFEIAQEKATRKLPASTHAARLLKLLEIGFVWNPLDVQWQEMYDKLVAYKKSNGHTLVPRECLEHPDLAEWVRNQRAYSETMSEARKTALDAIGFVWDPFEARWNEMFQRFSDLQAENASSNSTKWSEKDMDLYRWTKIQRQSYSRGALSKERISKLESTDFVWRIKSAAP